MSINAIASLSLIQLDRHLCNRFSGALPTKEILSAAPNHQTSLLMRVLQALFHVYRPRASQNISLSLSAGVFLLLCECVRCGSREEMGCGVFVFRRRPTHTLLMYNINDRYLG